MIQNTVEKINLKIYQEWTEVKKVSAYLSKYPILEFGSI